MSKQEIASTYSPLLYSPHFFDPPCKIKVVDASYSKKSLGLHFLLNGDMHQQTTRIHEIIDEWILLITTTKLSKQDRMYVYHTYLIGRLCHLLITTWIKIWLATNEKTIFKNVFYFFFKQSLPMLHFIFIILRRWS